MVEIDKKKLEEIGKSCARMYGTDNIVGVKKISQKLPTN